VEQAIVARIEIERLQQVRATLRADAIRTADRDWQWLREDECDYYVRMFNTSPHIAMIGLKRSGPGLRYLIRRWTEISTSLSHEGTLYGADRVELIQMRGDSAVIENLYFSEQAWEAFRDCLAAAPNPNPRDIEMICAPDVVPRSIQDRGLPLWRPDPEECRARLRAIVDRELSAAVALEARFRADYEEPSRAAAREQALARFEKENRHLLQTLRSHERSLSDAHRALATQGRGTGHKHHKTALGVNTE
jgi:hypothetical protein